MSKHTSLSLSVLFSVSFSLFLVKAQTILQDKKISLEHPNNFLFISLNSTAYAQRMEDSLFE